MFHIDVPKHVTQVGLSTLTAQHSDETTCSHNAKQNQHQLVLNIAEYITIQQ